jgi:hypothetical protein
MSLIAWQSAHTQNGMTSCTNLQNVIPQAEEVTLEAKITAIDRVRGR